MATLAAGSTVSVYCPLTGTMTVTPGTSGRVSINARGRDGSQSLAPRELYTAETLSVTAGDVVSLEAINVAATYTDPAEAGPALQALGSKGGIRLPAAANAVFTSYGVSAAGGAWGNTCATNITVGLISATTALSNEVSGFETYTRKVTISSAASEVRFNSANFTADPVEKALALRVYLPFMPSEFLGGSNPYIDVSIHNTTTFGANYSRWSFNAAYLRQGWNILKLRQADTVSATSGAGNLPVGANHNTDVGTGFDWNGTGQCLVLVFNNMNGQIAYIDQLRRPAKALPVVTIGFDASGFNATDEVFVTKVAPLFAQYGIRSYCTMTNIYELIFAGTQAWRRIANLYNNFSWDVINHTWSHGATEVGRVLTATSASSTSDVVTFNVSGGHGLPVNKVIKLGMQGGSTAAANVVADCTITSTTAFTYTAAGAGTVGSITGMKAYSYLSEVINSDTTENERLLKHELSDITRVLRGSGFSRGVPYMAYPNNSVPHLDVLSRVALDAGIKFGRAYRGGFTFVDEIGIDNPLNMGSFVMDSGASTFTQLSTIQAKVQAAIARGEHIHIFGHYILDDEDPANAAYVPVNPDYPPGQGGNPAPPGTALAGFGGWWYMSQLRSLIEDTIGPAIETGTLLAMSPSEYAAYMGGRDN